MGAVVSFLWPKNISALRTYVERVPSKIHTHESLMSDVPASVVEEARAEALRRSGELRGALAQDARCEMVSSRVSGKLAESLVLVEALDAVHAREGVEIVALNEDVTQQGKTAALWAKARGVPCVVLSHSCILGRLYTIHREAHGDSLAVFGNRGAQPYVDLGVDQNRIVVTGNPSWDVYHSLVPNRQNIRKELSTAHAFSPQDHVVLFATTWEAAFTAFSEVGRYEESLRAALRAVRELRELGVQIQLIIKERPSNAGDATLSKIIREEAVGFEPVITRDNLEKWIVASDAVISVNSNVSIEAAIAGTTAINLWSPMSWLNGPFFEATDGVLETSDDKLANALAHALGNAELRALLHKQSESFLQQTAPFVGSAAARVAELLVQSRKPGEQRYVWHELSDPKGVSDKGVDSVYYRSPRMDMLARLRKPPKLALDIGCGAGATAAEIKRQFPAATVMGIELNEEAAVLARERVDRVFQVNVESFDFASAGFAAGSIDLVLFPDVLEHLYDPWHLLNRIKPFLSPTAQILASIPNTRNLWLLSQLVAGRWEYAEDGLLDVTHIRFFTKKSILELFDQTGYRVTALYSNPDHRVPALQAPDGGVVNIDTPQLSLKNMSADDLIELRTLQFIVDAVPR